MPKPSALSFLGVAKEATPGTGVAATNYIPVTNIAFQDVIGYSEDLNIRGAMVKQYGEVQTTKHSSFSFGGDLFADSFGWVAAGILGDVTTTGGSAPYTHAMAVKNNSDGQPTSYSFNDNYVAANRQYPGNKFTDVDITLTGDGLLKYTAKGMGYVSSVVATPTATFTAVTPIPNWTAAVTVGGGTVTTLLDGSVSFKRPGTVIHTVQNSQAPYKVFVGGLEVTGKLTLIMEDDTELTRYLTNTQPSLDLNFTQGAGAGAQQVKFHMTNAAYLSGQPDRGKDFIAVPVTFTAIANTTDVGATGGYSPVKVTLQNALAASTYV